MKKLLLGDRYRKLLRTALEQNGFEPIWIPANPAVDNRLSGHVDLSIIKLPDKRLVVSAYIAGDVHFVNILTSAGYKAIAADIAPSPQYPGDVGLCACIVGNRIFHNITFTDPALLREYSGKYINVRQGYTKCMTCVIGDNSIITSDNGVASLAKKNGVDVLEISPGYFELAGYDAGFIGGSCFTDDKIVYFTGTISGHPEYSRILNYITAKGFQVIELTTLRAFDIGGAIVL